MGEMTIAPATPTEGGRVGGGWWPLVLVMVALTLLAYKPVWHAGFIWDDDDHLTANPAMTAPDGLRKIWSSMAVSRYYPLTLTTFWFEHRLWGLNPMPYHVVNIVVHAVNGALLFLLLRRWRMRAAWLAAMAWVLHPVNVESVAWITELKNTQSGLFFFLAVLCFLRSEWRKGGGWYTAAVVCGLAAMLSKPSTVVLPLVLLLCAWWERGRWRWADVWRVAPFLVMAAGTSLLAVIEQRGQVWRAGATNDWQLSGAARLIVAGKDVWFYAGKVVWPAGLTFVYPRWDVNAAYPTMWMPVLGALAMTVLLWRQRQQLGYRAALFGWSYFLTALLPVLGFINVFYFRYSFVADHFQYLASAGLVTVIVAGGNAVYERTDVHLRNVGIAAAAMVLAGLGALTWKQSEIYRDSQSVWDDTLAKNPDCWMAHLHVGLHLLDIGRVAEAIQHDEVAVQLKPDSDIAHYDYGNALAAAGRTSEAMEQYREAVRINPNYAEAMTNLGNLLLQAGQTLEAIDEYRRALRQKPGGGVVHTDLGSAYVKAGRLAEGIAEFQEAIRLSPGNVDTYNNLGITLQAAGRIMEAIAQYQEALRLNPQNAISHFGLGRALESEGKTAEALAQYEEALRLQPDFGLARDARARLRAGGQP
jgi:protein O-mannosyl-transferase